MSQSTESGGDSIRPLSHRQTMIWTGQMVDPDLPLYNMVHAFTLRAEIDVAAFQAAFVALVDGVDAMRTVIVDNHGEPGQLVLPTIDASVPFLDFTGQHQRDGLGPQGWLAARATNRLDLSDRLFDTALLKTGDRTYVWYLNQHHLITDAWAFSLILKRQGELYALALEDRLDEAEVLPPYHEFLEAEAALLGSAKSEKSVDYWRNKLLSKRMGSGEPLTFYGPRPDDAGSEMVRISAVIDGDRARLLNDFLASPGFASLSPELTALRFFHTVLAAYLHRLNPEHDLTIGTPFHNRANRRARQTVGLFMNLYPVVAEVDSDDTMGQLADKLGAEIFESLQHARIPIGAAEENGAFEVVLNYLNAPNKSFGNLPVEDWWIHSGSADRSQSMHWQIRRFEDEFRLSFDVKTALFSEHARQALVEQLLAIIDQWLAEPDVAVGSLRLLSATDHDRFVTGFNTAAVTAELQTSTVVQDFEAMVQRQPHTTAVEGAERTLTYDQLNRQANRLAHRLLAAGLGAGDFVGVLLPRSPAAVVAILGVLKAGGAYLPMEPAIPEGRLASIVKDTGARLICTDHNGRAKAETAGTAAVLFDDSTVFVEGGHGDGQEDNPAGATMPDATAYAIFTSGSTGVPKGVPVNHRGLNNYVTWARRQYTMGEPRRFALFTSLAFDLTVTSIFVPLTSGGAVVVYPDDVEDGTPAVVDVWRDGRAEIAKLTPSHLAVIRQLGLTAPDLKVLVIGGEDLSTDLAASVQRLHPDLTMYNEYGPTETVVGCMIHRFDAVADQWPSVPIGRPAANAEIYLLDRYGGPVSPGVIGEIHIGGPGVTDGYLGRPELTADRFVTRPQWLLSEAVDGADRGLLYRSGDLGRWRMGDGPPQLEFLGRADNQVKIRGHRIELGEIESTLAKHLEVEGAAVIVATDVIEAGSPGVDPGGRETSRLVAHYQAPAVIPVESLQALLGRSLPAYMLPTSYVHHQQLPLTTNGKVDRAKLADLPTTPSPANTEHSIMTQEDRHAAEILGAIWESIFGQPIDLGDNFFDLGGDSITAIQIVDRAATAGLDLTPRLLFSAQTLAAAAIASKPSDQQAPDPNAATTEAVGHPTGGHRLTTTQSGMLFHSLAAPGSGIYEGQIVHHLDGTVDADLLDRCWRRLAARHEAFRLTFHWVDGDEPRQEVSSNDIEPLTIHDCSHLPAVEARERVATLLADDRARGFDLNAGPPVRVTLIRSADEWLMVWSFHHIALDGWSIALAVNELLAAYHAEVAGLDWRPPNVRPFTDYFRWLGAQDQEQVEEFWTEQLGGFNAQTALPRSSAASTDWAVDEPGRVLSEDDRMPYASSQRDLASDLVTRLGSFTGSQRVTVSTVLLAAWGLVLARYEDSDDVVFGVTTSGRPASLAEAETMIGMLVTTLPTRIRIPGGTSAADWLRTIQADQLSVREHEYASLVDVQRWSELPASQPLFDSILVVENFPDYRPGGSSGSDGADDIDVLTVAARTYRVQSNYPLSIIVLPGEHLTIKAVYDPTQFSAERIDELLNHLEATLVAIVSDPARPVAELSVVGTDEQRFLLARSVGNPLPGADDSTLPLLPDLIRQRAAEAPGAIAVTSDGKSITYGELMTQAAAVADRLRADGAGPNTIVGILLERSMEMVVAIVGVMEAGAAYLPLDPTYPQERLRVMAADAAAPLVITHLSTDRWSLLGVDRDAASSQPVAGSGLVVLAIDADGAKSPATPDRPPGSDDLAYVIYTSGSTGRPNGVPITHGNLAYSTAARFHSYRHQPASFLLLSSFSFDSSIVGIFWTLAAGGRLVLPRPGEEVDVRALNRLIAENQVSHTLALPSLYRLLLDFSDRETLRSLKTVVVAGEPCPRALVESHLAALPGVDLYNEYGPTEASVWCTVHHCTGDRPGPVPIGGPIPGATVAVVDDMGRPSGVGVPGEIVIAGPGVAAGYLNRPDLTDERFVVRDGRRWFRTRDRGTVAADGVIEFGGRVDDQVKIRGHRVELGEVEAAIGSVPGVGVAVVVAHRADDRAATELVAFVEPDLEGEPAIQAGDPAGGAVEDLGAMIRSAVARRLPEPFVPSSVLVVDHLTRLPNGKVDRNKLPAITPGQTEAPTEPPSTPTEVAIAAIWDDLLPGTGFGLDDDFFEVGGHSLLAVSLVERVRRATGNELPLAALLDAPTIRALAAAVSGEGPAPEWRCLVPMRTTGERVPLYLIPPAAGTALSFRSFVADSDPNQPLYCFEPLGNDGVSEPHDTVEAMADQYIEELKTAQPDGRYRIGGSCLGAIVAWEMTRKLHEAGTPVELLVLLDPGPPHSGPTWSYSLPSQRSPLEFVRSAFEIVATGELVTAIKAVWRRNRFERIGRIHYRAQLSYVADRIENVPIIWLESSELAEDQPTFLDQWRILAGQDLTPIIIPDTTHDGLMTGDPDEVSRMAVLFDQAMDRFEAER